MRVMTKLSPQEVQKFRKIVWDYYKKSGRSFPWRKTRSPYRILVSEVMLQQTQTERVMKFYGPFLKMFPSFKVLAKSPLKKVLNAWQGLGYNRRALSLHKMADQVVTESGGRLPKSVESLMHLPGIGAYTANAIRAFVHDLPAVFIETNIRSVYIHHFFSKKKKVSDKEIEKLVEKTLDKKRPREWYYALMDYGVHLKKVHGNPNKRSKHYTKQSKFEGSVRQVRGAIIRILTGSMGLTKAALLKTLSFPPDVIEIVLEQLQKEGFLDKKGKRYVIR